MEKMWAGRAQEQLDQTADDFNSSIAVDQRMAEQDITGSIAHAKMLAAQGILDAGEVEKIIQGLEWILNDLKAGSLAIDPAAEDIHMFVEQVLTGADRRCGQASPYSPKPQRSGGGGSAAVSAAAQCRPCAAAESAAECNRR